MDKSQELKAKGNTAFQSGNYSDAVSFFTQAIQHNPSNHILFSNRSGAYVNLSKFQEALDDAHQSIILKPDYVRGYKRKGLALFKMNKLQQAIDVYETGLKLDPDNAELKSDLAEAQKALTAPNNQMYNQILMKLMMNPKTQHLLQKPEFMAKMQMCMSNPMMLIEMSKTDPDVKLILQALTGDFQMDKKDFEEEMPSPPQPTFEHKPQPKPEPKPEPKKDMAPGEDFKDQGNKEFKARNFEKAIEYFDKAIEANPEEVIFQNNKAAALIQLGKLEQAMVVVEGSIKLIQNGVVKSFEKNAKVYARKASILSKMGHLDESIKWYENSLLEKRDRRVEQDFKAVQQLKKKNEQQNYINPEIGQKVNEEGNTLFKEGKFPDALKKYEDAIKRNPKSAKFFANKGMCYIKLMQFARARDQFEKSISLDPNYIRPYIKKGDCHFFLKEYHKALDHYEKGLKIDPQNAACKEGIQKTKMAMMTTTSESDQEERAKHAMADPEIQNILREPEIRNFLEDLQQNPNSAAAQTAMRNPVIAGKINKLIAAGVIRMG